MDTAVKILCDVAGADPAASDVIVDRSIPVLAEVMKRDEIEDKVRKVKEIITSVARWQNLIPSFPWIAPGWRAGGAIQGKEGIKFCSAA